MGFCHVGGDTCVSLAELFGHPCVPCEDKSAKLLEEELSQRTNRWDHPCQVCDKAMTRGAEDHFKSKGHWSLGSVLHGSSQVKTATKVSTENPMAGGLVAEFSSQ